MSKDYYKILGVDKKASKVDIKKAFHKLAHKYHPDKANGDETKFKEASEAYSVLSDDKKRSEYDTYGQAFGGNGAPQGGFGGFSGFGGQEGVEFDLGDIFGDIFGGGQRRQKRGNDISIDIQITFAESIFGTDRKVMITKNSICDECKGTGAERNSVMETCFTCGGNGKIHETKQSFLGSFSTARICDKCRGKGKIPKNKCKDCRGVGIIRKQEEIKLKIPTGINNGEMMRMTGAGEAIEGGVAGDLYIKIHVSSHSDFKKEGNNLLMDLNVKLSDALLGAEYTVETLDEKIKVKIPKGVTYGEILRIRDKGVPISEKRRGDLYIKINIKLPNKLSRKAKGLIEDLKGEGI
ncbi:MAG: J domain-containing protein [Candidatus Pacebacteria bacterium]|nr:J domain-containing protein [Candidatus Paceibacterota bacterium]